MQAVSFSERRPRTHYRHELRTLTYVTLDEANGGIIRNINHEGVAVQAVAALRSQQRVRLRFELRFPRLRVEAYGQVSWASPSGQCGIRFVDLPSSIRQQIDQWIFSNLLDALARNAGNPRSIFGASVVSIARGEKAREAVAGPEEEDGLTLSAAPHAAIRLEPDLAGRDVPIALRQQGEYLADPEYEPDTQPNWLSRPLSGRALTWLVDSLAVVAGVLLFALIFLSIAHELPPWPLALGIAAVVFVAAIYRGVFAVFGGSSLGARLARAASGLDEEERIAEALRVR
jgi:hypothetical protein